MLLAMSFNAIPILVSRKKKNLMTRRAISVMPYPEKCMWAWNMNRCKPIFPTAPPRHSQAPPYLTFDWITWLFPGSKLSTPSRRLRWITECSPRHMIALNDK
jgi:hypothetical protein